MGLSLCCMAIMATPPKSRSIMIVQLNGSVEEIEHPITVAQVTGKQPKQHFIFTQSQLLMATAAATPLKMDVQLEAGRPYFMLPSTLFQSNVSPAELAPIARKLASIAQNSLSKSKSKSKSKS